MTEISTDANSYFETSLDLWLLIQPTGSDLDEWQAYEQGPGRFAIPSGFEACVRIKNIDDLVLLHLVEEVSRCPVVVYLNLSENRKITDEGLRRIAGLTQLKTLNLSSTGITDRGLVWLKDLKHLKSLNLSYCNRLTDAGLRYLHSMNHLTFIDLQGCPRIHHAAIIKNVNRRGLTIHS